MIIFLYGPDTFRSVSKSTELKEKFIREIDKTGANLSQINGEKTDLAKLNEAVSSSSLLAKKRLIIIEGLFKTKTDGLLPQFLELLKKHRDDKDSNIIVIREEVAGIHDLNKAKTEFFKFLSKQKYAQEFKILSNTETANWIRKEVEARGGKISQAAAVELAALAGSDLWQINNEIDKLISFKTGQKLKLGEAAGDFKIEPADVKELVTGTFDEKIFTLTDAIANRQKGAAIKLLEDQIEGGVSVEYILSMVLRQFKILLSMRDALDAGETPRKVATQLKLHPFVVQKSMAQARGFDAIAIKSIFDRLLAIDYQNKTGQAEILPSLNLLIAKL